MGLPIQTKLDAEAGLAVLAEAAAEGEQKRSASNAGRSTLAIKLRGTTAVVGMSASELDAAAEWVDQARDTMRGLLQLTMELRLAGRQAAAVLAKLEDWKL